MLALLRKQKPYAQEAKHIYAQCLQKARTPYFYSQLSVPDTMDGRFDVLILHVCIVMNATLNTKNAEAESLNQTLFDILFIDMDQTLREMGIGDMGIPKRMKRMMTGFNGRIHAYAAAMNDDTNLPQVLHRNIYNDNPLISDATLSALATYTKEQSALLNSKSWEQLLSPETHLFNGDSE